jgi:DUF1680 family protein
LDPNTDESLEQRKLFGMSLQRCMRSLPLANIKITDSFWSRWQNALIDVTLPAQYTQLVETGRIANFERAAGKKTGDFEGLWFNDSDVYKYAEACAYALSIRDDATVRTNLNHAIEVVFAAQQTDGYINTFFQVRHPTMKWRNLNMMHEMYCGGHLIEAGVAVYQCLGDRRLLDVSIRFADHVMSIFGPDKRLGYCGHEEIELALIKLAEATKEPKYREFARWMVEVRGHTPSPFEAELQDAEASALWPGSGSLLTKGAKYDGQYAQDHAPIREHTEIVGHAVRAMYLYIAAADLADGQNDQPLTDALKRIWDNLTGRRMYVTGGIGPSSSNEGFTADFDLPNLTAYAETCASCGLVFWGHKMLEMTGDGDYVDVMERALYNGALSGISLSGDHYFYANPLESRGNHERTPWFGCACCPPNIARLIGSLGHYIVGANDDSIFIHTPIGFEATTTIDDTKVEVKVESDYPWSGKYKVTVSPEKPLKFNLLLRIPAWSGEMEVDFPNAEEPADYEGGYALFDRVWTADDTLTVDLGMEPAWVEADPRVRENLGRVALTNGPLVYTLEQPDLGFAPQLFSADIEAPIEVQKAKVLMGVNVLQVQGLAIVDEPTDELFVAAGTSNLEEVTAKFIPYYAWANRGRSSMEVWVRRI